MKWCWVECAGLPLDLPQPITQYGLDWSGCQPSVSKPRQWSLNRLVSLSSSWSNRDSPHPKGRVEILSTFKEERTSYHIATDHHTITPHMVSSRSLLRNSLGNRQDITAYHCSIEARRSRAGYLTLSLWKTMDPQRGESWPGRIDIRLQRFLSFF